MIGDDEEGIQPWLLFPEGPMRDLMLEYEAVLTEMRTHSDAGDRMPGQWVRRLDQARDEFVRAVSGKHSYEMSEGERDTMHRALRNSVKPVTEQSND